MKQLALYLVLLVVTLGWFSPQTDTYSRNGKTLIVTNTYSDLDAAVKEGLVETFFTIYPKITQAFNPKAPDTIRVKIDTAYSGVAYAHDGQIVISSAWLEKKPNDTDVIIHEAMHIVQNYPGGSGPGWLTEGIADYVRYKYGVDNKGAGWFLTEFSPQHNYTNSYRITARFLLWLTQQYEEDLVKRIDEQIRNNNYSDDLWESYTGKSLDALWGSYSKNPELIIKEKY